MQGKKIVNCYKKQKLFGRNENERIICTWKTASKHKCGESLFSLRLFVETECFHDCTSN